MERKATVTLCFRLSKDNVIILTGCTHLNGDGLVCLLAPDRAEYMTQSPGAQPTLFVAPACFAHHCVRLAGSRGTVYRRYKKTKN